MVDRGIPELVGELVVVEGEVGAVEAAVFQPKAGSGVVVDELSDLGQRQDVRA
jgi:hypothetical protein